MQLTVGGLLVGLSAGLVSHLTLAGGASQLATNPRDYCCRCGRVFSACNNLRGVSWSYFQTRCGWYHSRLFCTVGLYPQVCLVTQEFSKSYGLASSWESQRIRHVSANSMICQNGRASISRPYAVGGGRRTQTRAQASQVSRSCRDSPRTSTSTARRQT